MEMFDLYTIEDLFDLTHTVAAPLLAEKRYPWEALPDIGAFIRGLGASLPAAEYDHPEEDIWLARTARIAPSVSITGPCIVCPGTIERISLKIRSPRPARIKFSALLTDGLSVIRLSFLNIFPRFNVFPLVSAFR